VPAAEVLAGAVLVAAQSGAENRIANDKIGKTANVDREADMKFIMRECNLAMRGRIR